MITKESWYRESSEKEWKAALARWERSLDDADLAQVLRIWRRLPGSVEAFPSGSPKYNMNPEAKQFQDMMLGVVQDKLQQHFPGSTIFLRFNTRRDRQERPFRQDFSFGVGGSEGEWDPVQFYARLYPSMGASLEGERLAVGVRVVEAVIVEPGEVEGERIFHPHKVFEEGEVTSLDDFIARTKAWAQEALAEVSR